MIDGNQSPTGTKQREEYEGMVMMGNENEASTTRTVHDRKVGNMMSKADKASDSKTKTELLVIKINSTGSDGNGPGNYQSKEEEPMYQTWHYR
ncbi:hypothetical protein AAC387_Pa03g1057 [Persea americana]